MRNYSFLDKLIMSLSGTMVAGGRENPSKGIPEAPLSQNDQKHIAGLMRINYAGEVCAQALYQGQALVARNPEIKIKLEQAGLEEEDHLRWCQSRIHELNSHVSFLNPLWYAGSFTLGVVAGLCGDKWSLGFLEETEKQVTRHLEEHLEKIPQKDHKTRAILEQMRDEEKAHAEAAYHLGSAELPKPIAFSMTFIAKLMTTTTYYL